MSGQSHQPDIQEKSALEHSRNVTNDYVSMREPQPTVGGHGLTQRRLRNYQITMMGFCSGIGTGLFIGTGAAYAKAGPAGLLMAYTIVGGVLWCVMQSIAELATWVRKSPDDILALVSYQI